MASRCSPALEIPGRLEVLEISSAHETTSCAANAALSEVPAVIAVTVAVVLPAPMAFAAELVSLFLNCLLIIHSKINLFLSVGQHCDVSAGLSCCSKQSCSGPGFTCCGLCKDAEHNFNLNYLYLFLTVM